MNEGPLSSIPVWKEVLSHVLLSIMFLDRPGLDLSKIASDASLCSRISTSASSPILDLVLGTQSLPDPSLVTSKIGLSGAGSVGLYVATGLTFWFIST